MLKNNFCNYYDQGLFIGSDSYGDPILSMCCWQQKEKVNKIIFDHPYLESIRKEGSEKIPQQCSEYCRVSGLPTNEREQTRKESCWDNSGKKIKKLHLEQSLACNLGCISCSTQYSSYWNKEYHHFVPDSPIIKLKKNPEQSWKHLDLSYLSALHFTGGEPLMNPDNKKILRHLNEIGRLSEVNVTYNTNGTILPDDELTDLWKKCQYIRLHISLDGVGSTFEYTRYPAKWAEVVNNIKLLTEMKDICIIIGINAVVGIHNIFNMLAFYNYWKSECQFGSQGDPTHALLRHIDPISYGGKVLSLTNLPNEYKRDAIDMLQSIKDLDGAEQLIPILSTKTSNEWVEYLDKLDKLRKLNWRKQLMGPITKYG